MPNVVYGRSQGNINYAGRVITLDTTPAQVITPASIIDSPNINLTNYVDLIGALGPSATLNNFIKVTRTGGLSFIGLAKKKLTLLKTIFTAGLSFTGAAKKKTLRKLLGGASFTGVVKRLTKAKRTGVLSFVGLAKRLNKLKKTGSLSFSGGLKKKTFRRFIAGLSFIGSLKRKGFIALVAGLSFTGAIKRQTSLKLTSVLSFIGSLTKAIGAKHIGILNLGSESFSSSLTKQTFKTFRSSLDFLGTLAAKVPKLVLLFLKLLGLKPRLSIELKLAPRLWLGIKVSNRLSIKCSPMQLEIRTDTDVTINVMDLLISSPVTDAVVSMQLYTGRNDIDPLRLPGEPVTDVIICAKVNENGDYLGTIPRGALIDISQSYTIVVDAVSGDYTAHREFKMPLVTGGE